MSGAAPRPTSGSVTAILSWAFPVPQACPCTEAPSYPAAECISVHGSAAADCDVEQGLPRVLGAERGPLRDDEDGKQSSHGDATPVDSIDTSDQATSADCEGELAVSMQSSSETTEAEVSSPTLHLQQMHSSRRTLDGESRPDGDAVVRNLSVTNTISSNISSRVIHSVSTISRILSSSLPESIEEMDERREEKRLRRERAFNLLIGQQEPTEEEDEDLVKASKPRPWVALRSAAGAALGALYVFSGFASIPMKDVILPGNASHWWECMLQCATIWTWATAAMLIVTTYSVMMNKNSGFPLMSYFQVCLAGSLVIISVWVTETFFWDIAKLVYPFPWVGGIAGQLALYTMAFATFFTFPKAWLQDPVFRRRALWLSITYVTFNFLLLAYWFLGAAFVLLPDERKWLLTPLVPVIREVGGFLVTKFAKKAAATTDFAVELVVTNLIATAHALFLAVCLTAQVPEKVGYALLAVDFLSNLYLGLTATRFHNHADDDKRNKSSEALQIMLLNESLEFFIPLAYLVCFLVAFYRPNAHVNGTIKNGYWHFTAQDDVVAATWSLLMLTLIDAISLIINGLVMYFRNGVNLWKVFLFMQKQWGWVMAVQQAFVIEQQFCVIAIGCAIDFTFKFDWL